MDHLLWPTPLMEASLYEYEIGGNWDEEMVINFMFTYVTTCVGRLRKRKRN